MGNLTRGGIAYNLDVSPYKYAVEYPDETITFIFSSEVYRKKFIEKYDKNRDVINNSLSNRFGFSVKTNKLADLKLYTSIEKRGFLIYKGMVRIECLNEIILIGNQMMKRN